ncbi:hypothetical protein HK405_015680, partial [Cladochytrium tenue]
LLDDSIDWGSHGAPHAMPATAGADDATLFDLFEQSATPSRSARAELASSSATAAAVTAAAPDPAAAAVTRADLAVAEVHTIAAARGSGFMVGATTPPGAEANLIDSQVLTPREACHTIFHDVTRTLCHLHALGVHHGNIKPGTSAAEVHARLCNFGHVCHLPTLDTPEHRLVSYGTLVLSAPELFPNLAVGAAVYRSIRLAVHIGLVKHFRGVAAEILGRRSLPTMDPKTPHTSRLIELSPSTSWFWNGTR